MRIISCFSNEEALNNISSSRLCLVTESVNFILSLILFQSTKYLHTRQYKTYKGKYFLMKAKKKFIFFSGFQSSLKKVVSRNGFPPQVPVQSTKPLRIDFEKQQIDNVLYLHDVVKKVLVVSREYSGSEQFLPVLREIPSDLNSRILNVCCYFASFSFKGD